MTRIPFNGSKPVPYNGGPVWALDPASTTGVAMGLPRERPTLLALKLRQNKTDTPHDVFERAVVFMAESFGPSLPRGALPGLLVIEQPIPPPQLNAATSFDATMIAFGLHGIFVGIARAKSIPVVVAPIGSWRKYFLGSGRLSGIEAKRSALRLCGQLGWETDDHNAAEAAGIWSWAVSQIDPRAVQRVEPLFARAR